MLDEFRIFVDKVIILVDLNQTQNQEKTNKSKMQFISN